MDLSASALAPFGAPEAVPVLLKDLNERDRTVREFAAKTLGQINLSPIPIAEQITVLRQAIRNLEYLSVEVFLPILNRLEALEASQLGSEIEADPRLLTLRRSLRAVLTVIAVFLLAGLIGLLMILARIFDDILKAQWASGLQTMLATRPLLASALVVLLAGLIALLTWSMAKFKERK